MDGFIPKLLSALSFGLGYNASLVTLGALLFGLSAGGAGTFIFLRKRSMVSDAIAHATLPGIGIAFLVMAVFGGDGRFLPGLMLGAGLSAAFGLYAVGWMVRRTRLSEDASIGAVLSVTFAFGIVMLTVVQVAGIGRPAGLEGFLLGSAAGMLRADAITLMALSALSCIILFSFRRHLILIAFDETFAATQGLKLGISQFLAMALVLFVSVIGLQLVGLVLVVALMIIPPATARFWTNAPEKLFALSALFGGLAGYLGTAISATAASLPTGPIIVLVAFAFFAISMLLSPLRGVVAAWLRHHRFSRRVHMRQGLLALARGDTVFEPYTRKLLMARGLMRADGTPTLEGRAAASHTLRDEARWQMARSMENGDMWDVHYDGLRPIEEVLTPDEIALVDREIGAIRGVAG